MYYVYVLRSKRTRRFYVGYTRNVEARLKYHNSGRTKSLLRYIPLEIILVEEYSLYEEARKRELQIKRYKSGEAFKKLINS